MKKFLILTGLIFFLNLAGSAFAATVTGTSVQTINSGTTSATTQTKTGLTKLTSLQQKAAAEITRRLDLLNELLTKINSIQKISDSDKTSLQEQINQQISGLTQLLNKINSDSDLTTLKTDVKSVVTDYYIFAFFRIKVNLMLAADRLVVASVHMDLLYNKLQTRVAALKTQGVKVANMEAYLSDMRKKIDDANLQYNAAQTLLSSLDAKGFPGNKSSLLSARSKVMLAATDLKNVFKDVELIRAALLKLEGSTTPATDSAKLGGNG